MPSRLSSAALIGIDATPVDIEVDVLPGVPSFTVVGLGDTAIKESKERITAALSNLGYKPPRRKTIVSLAPASLKKEGSRYDLPIALGFLLASKQINIQPDALSSAWLAGELSLDGSIKPIRGILPIALAAAQSSKIKEIYIPAENSPEASAVADKIKVYPVRSLEDIIEHFSTEHGTIAQLTIKKKKNSLPTPETDFADIKGQEMAKRALLIAAAASHNVLLVGSPGTGKTLLARALAGILPQLTREESHTVTSLYSIAGLLEANSGLIEHRPFRSPHHGASSVALVGGGQHPKPGEVSLAHTGVLFMDELPEFSRQVLDHLRQPIEDGYVTVSRASRTVKFPARFILVGAMNPCKCGFLGSQRRECGCTANDVLRYQRRISGPLLDRFDMHIMVNDIPLEELLEEHKVENKQQSLTSNEALRKTEAAHTVQYQRQGKPNAELTAKEIKKHCGTDQLSKNLLHQAEERFHLSSRAVHRILKVARTIADLEGEANIQAKHMAEGLQYREQLKEALPDFV